MTRSTLLVRIVVAAAMMAVAAIATPINLPLWARLQQPERVYKSDDKGITLPVVITEVHPQYTAEAMTAKVQGQVILAAVVLASGDVGEVTVLQSLDAEHGLDREAVRAARLWKFAPGTLAGAPVPVEITITMTFTLNK